MLHETVRLLHRARLECGRAIAPPRVARHVARPAIRARLVCEDPQTAIAACGIGAVKRSCPVCAVAPVSPSGS